MTQRKDSATGADWRKILGSGPDGLRQVVQEVLEAEMDETVAAQKGERTPERLGYRSRYYTRTFVTQVGKLVLRVPQDRQGRFRTEVFERYQRSEKALVCALTEMYIQGVSMRKVKEITEQLCGHEFSASTISRMTGQLDEELKKFARRLLEEEYPYVVLDAHYGKVRQDGIITSQAVQVAIGINWKGRRCVLGVELANRESESSWKEFLLSLKQRGSRGLVFVISDDHAGPRKAIPEVFARNEMAALLCAFPAQCAGLSTAEER
jgi:transposase-like protein